MSSGLWAGAFNGGTNSGSYNPPRRQGKLKHCGIAVVGCARRQHVEDSSDVFSFLRHPAGDLLVTMVALSYLPSLVLGLLLERFRCQTGEWNSTGVGFRPQFEWIEQLTPA